MPAKLFSPQPLWQSNGLATLRIITGLLMAYHGLEVFDSHQMQEYMKWDVTKTLPAPHLMIYLGKGLEFLTGIMFILGLFTRVAALLMVINMLFICFRVGHGKFYYEDQHPFLFAMLAMVFFFSGPVKWSVDQWMFPPKNPYHSY
ncbi:MAG: DoxX family protein [Ferruginibacter sp.]|nr:DoxX family protein [Ferruginibacter sp.]